MEGLYTSNQLANDMNVWTHVEKDYAIWYVPTGTHNYWVFGPTSEIGTLGGFAFATLENINPKCPNDAFPWVWIYYDSVSQGYLQTVDFLAKCANEDDFCTSGNPCAQNEGDCDNHLECQNGFFCGVNNCPDSLG